MQVRTPLCTPAPTLERLRHVPHVCTPTCTCALLAPRCTHPQPAAQAAATAVRAQHAGGRHSEGEGGGGGAGAHAVVGQVGVCRWWEVGNRDDGGPLC